MRPLVAALCACVPASAVAQAATTTSTAAAVRSSTTTSFKAKLAEALTTPHRAEPEPPLDLPGLVLDLPGAFLELALMPLEPLVSVADEYQLHERLFDLVTNDERTFAMVPVVELLSRSGVGFGGAAIHNDPLGSANVDALVVLARVNGDVSADATVQRRFSQWNGRTVGLSARYSLDQDYRYYGLGPRDTERRLLSIQAVDLQLAAQLFSPADTDFRLHLEASFHRRETGAGVGVEPGLSAADALEIPGGFGQELHYPAGAVRLELDTRDSRGRTTRGVVASVEGRFSADIEGATSVFRATAKLAMFAPILPLQRVIFVGLGASAAVPLAGDLVPLHELIHLGGGGSLRGYDSDRFSGAVGWWGSAEYRYKIFQEADTGHGLSSVLFVDVGSTARRVDEMLIAPLRWSAGLAFRVETNLFLLGRFQLGFSPEGVEVSVAIGELL